MKKVLAPVFLLFVLSLSMQALAQSAPAEASKRTVKKWFKKKEWLGGLALEPHKSIDKPEFYRQYQKNKIYWDKAFAYLKNNDLPALSIGRHDIDSSRVYASVTQNATKDYDSTQWESHRKYIDLQYVISGEEKIGVSPLGNVTVTKPYDATKDLANYSGDGKLHLASPGTFFLFFPSDAHRPNITTGDKKPDKKIVIKIAYAD